MRKRPLVITLVALALALLPVAIFYYAWNNSGRQFRAMSSVLWAEVALFAGISWLAAVGVWRVRAWGYYAFFGFLMVVIGFDVFHLYEDSRQNWQWFVMDALLVALGFWVFRLRSVHEPYFSPQVRWWERASRYRAEIEAKIYTSIGTIPGTILDLSETGCFIDCDLNLEGGSTAEIYINWEGYEFHSKMLLVRKSDNPRGLGFQFFVTQRPQLLSIRKIILELREKSKKSA